MMKLVMLLGAVVGLVALSSCGSAPDPVNTTTATGSYQIDDAK